MVTSKILKSRLPNLDEQRAEDLAEKINEIASAHQIDDDEIVRLLGKDPDALEAEIDGLEENRKRLKLEAKKTIMQD